VLVSCEFCSFSVIRVIFLFVLAKTDASALKINQDPNSSQTCLEKGKSRGKSLA